MQTVWRVEMLGAWRVQGDDAVVTRFRTRRVGLLLAYLAFYRDKLHSRDEIGEMLWPERDSEVIRRNLRQALTSLRHAIEPPALPPGSILQVQQSGLRLNQELVTTDVAEFEHAVEQARRAEADESRYALLKKGIGLYRGELLPTFSEDWVLRERLRLEDLYVYALREIAKLASQTGQLDEAIQHLRLALAREPLDENTHLALMRHYLDSGRPASAVSQYADLETQLREHLDSEPSEQAKALFRLARQSVRSEDAVSERPAPAPPASDPVLAEGPAKCIVRLPVQLTRFCGRLSELEGTLTHLLERRAPLTTIAGPAGTGKTRLAVEVGNHLGRRGDWNVWFVPLADISDGSILLDAVLDVMRVRRSPPRELLDQLQDAIPADSNNLLILDNLEHIVAEAAPIVGQIVSQVKNLHCLVTSRHVLRLEAEHLVDLAPLPFPYNRTHEEPIEREELAELASYPSVQLFVDRCQAVRPDFQLTAHNAHAIATICEKLEGVPLALELAAGLSASFAPTQMVFHLDNRLTALASRRRDMPERHRSLRAAIDYSYDTLTERVRTFFTAISVFRGGFSIQAVYEICYAPTWPSSESPPRRHPHEACLDAVLELQERSLLRSEHREGSRDLRFRMLESFREYAEEHLPDADLRDLRDRHAEFYLSHPPASSYPLSVEEITGRHLWIESEFDNFIAALDHCFQQGRYEACIRLLSTLAITWTSRGPRTVERRYIRQIADRLSEGSVDPVLHIQLLRMLGTTYIRSSDYLSARRACTEALAIAERSGIQEQIAICYSALSTCAGYLGRLDECLELSQRVLQLAPEENLLLFERAHLGIGAVHWGRGEIDLAEQSFLRAEDVSCRLHGGEPDTLILYNLARVLLDKGRYDEAMSRLGDALRICQRLHDDFGQAMSLSLVGRYHWLKRNQTAAIATSHEALVKYRACDFSHWSLLGIHQHALILADMGEWEAATTLFAASRGIGRSARLPDDRDLATARETIRKHLTSAAFERAWARGLAMDTPEAFRLALRFK